MVDKKKKRRGWWLVAAVLLAAVYILSLGPAMRWELATKKSVSSSPFYRPLLRSMDSCPRIVRDAYYSYLFWWTEDVVSP